MSDVDELDNDALTAAHKAVEDALIELRDNRVSVMDRGNGVVIREFDGVPSPVMRLGTREALDIGIRTYLAAVEDGRHE